MNLTPLRKLIFGYLGLALFGWVILCLPGVNTGGVPGTDHLFVAFSALTTTGLVTVNVAESYTFWGELVTLLLFQIGGIGYMSLAGSFLFSRLYATGDGDDMVDEDYSIPDGMSLLTFVRTVVIFTLVSEAIGATILAFAFSGAGEEEAVWKGIYVAVSGFCTAGFHLFGDSLVAYRSDWIVNATLMSLMLMGSFGFLFVTDVVQRVRDAGHRLNLTTKLIGGIMVVLLILSFLGFYLAGGLPAEVTAEDRVVASLFQTVSTVSTTGFYTVSISNVGLACTSMVIVLMFIGASPSGTGGGIKNTTLATTLAYLWAVIRDRDHTVLFEKRLPSKRVGTATGAFLAGLLFLVVGATAVLFLQDLDTVDGWFEATSALGTVGLSRSVTASLSTANKFVIIALMFCGRIGSLSILISLARPSQYRAPDDGSNGEEDVAVEE